MAVDPISIITLAIGVLGTAATLIYTYNRKISIALTYIAALCEIINLYMKGNLDHVWTDEEKLALADKVIALGYRIENDTGIELGLTS